MKTESSLSSSSDSDINRSSSADTHAHTHTIFSESVQNEAREVLGKVGWAGVMEVCKEDNNADIGCDKNEDTEEDEDNNVDTNNHTDDRNNDDNENNVVITTTKTDKRKACTPKKTKTTQNDNWNEMFTRLVAYKKEHKGSTIVVRSYAVDRKLARWVGNQRAFYKMNPKTISKPRITRLTSIGFVWERCDSKIPWDDMFQRLVTYKKEHNETTNVPRNYGADPKLANWVNTQRKNYPTKNKNKTITTATTAATTTTINADDDERNNRLESIGFIWNALDAHWIEMYNRLVAYHEQNKINESKSNKSKSTQVPQHYTKDPPLGLWVHKQRSFYKKNQLTEKRLQLLNLINFR